MSGDCLDNNWRLQLFYYFMLYSIHNKTSSTFSAGFHFQFIPDRFYRSRT